MFFFTYLRRELRHRMRQATVTAVGLALGIALVITVTALVTHDSFVARRAQRIAVMTRGRLSIRQDTRRATN